MKAISIFFLSLITVLGSDRVHAEPADLLKPFTGYFRNLEYNGVENLYSTKFFVPSIALEISGRYKTENGDRMRVLSLNFEVPVREAEGTALRFLFLEIPLDGASVQTLPTDVTEIVFDGRIQERQGENWVTCRSRTEGKLSWRDSAILKIDLQTTAEIPCASGSHRILGSKVQF